MERNMSRKHTGREIHETVTKDKCCNCGATENLQYHHIVPLSVGGNDIPSNIAVLCVDCHSKIHFENGHTIPYSRLISAGMQKSNAGAKIAAARVGKTYETQKAKKCKSEILRLSNSFDGSMSDANIIKQLGIARGTYYKYKRQLMEGAATI